MAILFPIALTAQTTSPVVIASSGDYYSNPEGSLSWTLGEPLTETFSSGSIILTQGFQQPVILSIQGIDLEVFAFLEGPMDVSEMNALLRVHTDFPLSQPYTTAPWNYSGTESVADVPEGVVDWVLIELRDAPSAGEANSATTIARSACFIMEDGSVKSLNGSENPIFEGLTVENSLFVVVFHRNHLGILSAGAMVKTANTYAYDFTSGVDKAWGGAAGYKELAPGIAVMVAADGNADGTVNLSDKTVVWTPNAGRQGYMPADFNMDTQTNNPDKNDYLIPNIEESYTSQVPE